MRKMMIAAGAAMALATGAAQAQNSAWGYFEGEGGLLQAGLGNAEGQQLLIKCDESGDNKVFAAIHSPQQLAGPQQRAPSRDVRMQLDGGRVIDTRWRFYPNTAIALNNRRESVLPDLVLPMADANELTVWLDPEDGTEIRMIFNVAGARDAINRVFESCDDDANPLAG
ncbi:hypothetical protein [Alteraurantiacibacter aquimixticola]|uniref:Uncharacterized protein n=1 Tax=Alteraurantiacibacter aquimixticola TaxID=2489173 RepID=A0A4T3F1P9_9SPHN|nr:hypothetical protein [Alteraurantiacibacter aquimixticola]TIX51133.1 hypothetical protein E5222_01235 [Alteraurantiacibacter aquimixticola]